MGRKYEYIDPSLSLSPPRPFDFNLSLFRGLSAARVFLFLLSSFAGERACYFRARGTNNGGSLCIRTDKNDFTVKLVYTFLFYEDILIEWKYINYNIILNADSSKHQNVFPHGALCLIVIHVFPGRRRSFRAGPGRTTGASSQRLNYSVLFRGKGERREKEREKERDSLRPCQYCM